MKQKLLYVCHNHPEIYPGGTEICALNLYEGMRTSEVFEPLFLARHGSTARVTYHTHPGTSLSPVNSDPHQYFFHTESAHFDYFFGKLESKYRHIYMHSFREFLGVYRPDLVHFQHTNSLGYDLIRATKDVLPHAPIVYHLHEFLPICHHNGQMIRTFNHELCSLASPRRCHECFPTIAEGDFFLRERFIKSHLNLVDLFLAPSQFLLERYVAWGIPSEKIRCIENGRRLPPRLEGDAASHRRRNRFGFFGQFSEYKGLLVLLRAMAMVIESGSDIHLTLFGTNLAMQPSAFQEEFHALLDARKQNVTLHGQYRQDDLARLMADIDWVVVPSIWWENSPLVIQEAFQYRRPVICSNVGGMREKVQDGINGLHFQVNNPLSLALTMQQAADTPDLWETLRTGIPDLFAVESAVERLTTLYRALLRPEKATDAAE